MLSTKNQAQFKELVNTAVRGGASDIHLSVGALPVMRINGTLQTITEDVVITTEFAHELAAHLAGLDEKEVQKESELFFAVNLDPGFRVKVTIFYQKGLPAVTIRFIPHQIKTLEQLSLPVSLEGLINRPKGLVVVTGPYGSGKSATIAALVQRINAERKSYIVTLEKPIEYLYTSQLSIIEQREVGKDTVSFERGLDYLRHEDVDVVVVSSLSSEEAVIAALELAQGNALVIVALEANSVTGALEKLMQEVSADKRHYVLHALAESLIGTIALKLIPKIGGGLVPVVELLFATEPVRLAISKEEFHTIENIIETGAQDGMLSFDRSLIEYVKKHIITPEDARKFATHPKTIERMLGPQRIAR